MSDKILGSGFGVNSSPQRPRDMDNMYRRAHYSNGAGDRKANPSVSVNLNEVPLASLGAGSGITVVQQKPMPKKFVTKR